MSVLVLVLVFSLARGAARAICGTRVFTWELGRAAWAVGFGLRFGLLHLLPRKSPLVPGARPPQEQAPPSRRERRRACFRVERRYNRLGREDRCVRPLGLAGPHLRRALVAAVRRLPDGNDSPTIRGDKHSCDNARCIHGRDRVSVVAPRCAESAQGPQTQTRRVRCVVRVEQVRCLLLLGTDVRPPSFLANIRRIAQPDYLPSNGTSFLRFG